MRVIPASEDAEAELAEVLSGVLTDYEVAKTERAATERRERNGCQLMYELEAPRDHRHRQVCE